MARQNEVTGQISMVTAAGPVHLGQRVEIAKATNVAEFSRLPKAGGRCAVSGASRTWLIETNAKLPIEQRFLVKVRRRGCLRGTVFVSVPKLYAFLRAVPAGKVAGFVAEGATDED